MTPPQSHMVDVHLGKGGQKPTCHRSSTFTQTRTRVQSSVTRPPDQHSFMTRLLTLITTKSRVCDIQGLCQSTRGEEESLECRVKDRRKRELGEVEPMFGQMRKPTVLLGPEKVRKADDRTVAAISLLSFGTMLKPKPSWCRPPAPDTKIFR